MQKENAIKNYLNKNWLSSRTRHKKNGFRASLVQMFFCARTLLKANFDSSYMYYLFSFLILSLSAFSTIFGTMRLISPPNRASSLIELDFTIAYFSFVGIKRVSM